MKNLSVLPKKFSKSQKVAEDELGVQKNHSMINKKINGKRIEQAFITENEEDDILDHEEM